MELSRNQIQTKIFECSYIYLVYRNMNISFDVEKIISEICEDSYDNCDLFLRETILKIDIVYDYIRI